MSRGLDPTKTEPVGFTDVESQHYHPPASNPHIEKHTHHGNIIRDLIIGFSDGLTVPFALCAGLSSLGSTRLVTLAGLAELFAGAISMGLGAWLACVTESQHYDSEEARERAEILSMPAAEEAEIYDILIPYGLSRGVIAPVVEELKTNHDAWVRFMMDFELRLEKPANSRSWISAATMGLAYFGGGVLPMVPYFAMHNASHALFVSIGVTAVILVVFGYLKSWATVSSSRQCVWGAVQTLGVGAAAAGVSYGVVRGVNMMPGSTGLAG